MITVGATPVVDGLARRFAQTRAVIPLLELLPAALKPNLSPCRVRITRTKACLTGPHPGRVLLARCSLIRFFQ